MTLVVALLVVVVAILALLVAGLLRSHAAMLRHLHELGIGLYDDPHQHPAAPPRVPATPRPNTSATGRTAADLTGTTPAGDAVAYSLGHRDQDTLLLFLSVDCAACQVFWDAVADGRATDVETRGRRLLVVTKDPEEELAATLAGRPTRVPIVRSSQAWRDYDVPGSPYLVHVDGPSGRVRGEGTSASWAQLLDLVERGAAETAARWSRDVVPPRDSDDELLAMGLRPGNPSLYPDGTGQDDYAERPR